MGYKNSRPVGGGDINQSYILHTTDGPYFVKCNHAELLSMFEAETEGLLELSRTNAVRVPKPLCTGTTHTEAYLVMEYIDLDSGKPLNYAVFGDQLAEQHRLIANQFGWRRDNTIGSTPQINTPADDWVDFFRLHRLGYQLRLVEENGASPMLIDKCRQLLDKLHQFFINYTPQPTLLHGDLWRGNVAADQNGDPVIYDPAVYYGDRETDIAMTTLFGGFAESFYAAYQQAWPLDPGYATRKHLYNLYHILNHLNLFGGSYEIQAQRMIDLLLSEIR